MGKFIKLLAVAALCLAMAACSDDALEVLAGGCRTVLSTTLGEEDAYCIAPMLECPSGTGDYVKSCSNNWKWKCKSNYGNVDKVLTYYFYGNIADATDPSKMPGFETLELQCQTR
ncbi:MAG: hypothetical protein FWC26_03275 [Fibromonadales bacterium]|nr:hypothetical protein [Fibromonadales bacterium]